MLFPSSFSSGRTPTATVATTAEGTFVVVVVPVPATATSLPAATAESLRQSDLKAVRVRVRVKFKLELLPAQAHEPGTTGFCFRRDGSERGRTPAERPARLLQPAAPAAAPAGSARLGLGPGGRRGGDAEAVRPDPGQPQPQHVDHLG